MIKYEQMHHVECVMNVTKPDIDPAAVLSRALLNAGRDLGLSQEQLGRVVGRDRTRLKGGIRPDTKVGELALLFIRCYRGLFALVDGDLELMRHWMHTYNTGTRGVPAEQVQSAQGLITVLEYLDAIRGKV